MLNVIIFIMGVVSLILQFVSKENSFFEMDEVTIVERLIGMVCISLPLFLIVLIIPEGFGGGDIKLMFAAGFFLGWKQTVVGFFHWIDSWRDLWNYLPDKTKERQKRAFCIWTVFKCGTGCFPVLRNGNHEPLHIEFLKSAMHPELY